MSVPEQRADRPVDLDGVAAGRRSRDGSGSSARADCRCDARRSAGSPPTLAALAVARLRVGDRAVRRRQAASARRRSTRRSRPRSSASRRAACSALQRRSPRGRSPPRARRATGVPPGRQRDHLSRRSGVRRSAPSAPMRPDPQRRERLELRRWSRSCCGHRARRVLGAGCRAGRRDGTAGRRGRSITDGRGRRRATSFEGDRWPTEPRTLRAAALDEARCAGLADPERVQRRHCAPRRPRDVVADRAAGSPPSGASADPGACCGRADRARERRPGRRSPRDRSRRSRRGHDALVEGRRGSASLGPGASADRRPDALPARGRRSPGDRGSRRRGGSGRSRSRRRPRAPPARPARRCGRRRSGCGRRGCARRCRRGRRARAGGRPSGRRSACGPTGCGRRASSRPAAARRCTRSSSSKAR